MSAKKAPSIVVVHVLRDPSSQLAEQMRRADLQFGLTKPHLSSGAGVMTAVNEGGSFAGLLQRFTDSPSDLVILNLQSDLPADATLREQLGTLVLVCGGRPAYIPSSVPNEKREGAEMYLRFLKSHC
jgi:hypothetical protein